MYVLVFLESGVVEIVVSSSSLYSVLILLVVETEMGGNVDVDTSVGL